MGKTTSTGRKTGFATFLIILLFFSSICPAYANTATAKEPWLSRVYDKTLSEEWMNVLFQGNKIGFVTSKIEQGTEGYRFTGRAVIRMTVMDQPQDFSFSHVYYMDSAKAPLGFATVQMMQNQRMQTSGVIGENEIELTVSGVGGGRTMKIPMKKGTLFADMMDMTLKDMLQVGKKTSIPIFVPELRASDVLTMETTGKTKIDFDGKPVEVFVIETKLQGMLTKTFITPEGEKLKEESPMGFTMVKTTELDAMKMQTASVPVAGMITMSLVKPDKTIPHPGELSELKLSLGGLDNTAVVPADDRQIVGDPVFTDGVNGTRKRHIPVTFRKIKPGAMTISQAGAAQPEYLKPTPELQSDNMMIQREAKKIIGAETDAYKAAKLINQWVHKKLKKKLSDNFTAIDAYLSREGECQSHTNLFAAMARSVGIPAKTAQGLVYSTENGGFLYHAWPEVYTGQWVAMDPTIGQDQADVSHVKLLEGGVEEQLKLFQFVVKINISVESFKK